MTDELEAVLRELRQTYLTEAPARIAELRKDAAAFRAGEPDAARSLVLRTHRLAGSGGSYGFPEISRLARELEHWLVTEPPRDAPAADRLDAGIDAIAAAFDAESAAAGVASASPRPAVVVGRARLVAPPGAPRDAIADALRGAGYTVDLDAGEAPADVPASSRPDLVAIAVDDTLADPFALATGWSSLAFSRPRAVVLVEGPAPLDRLRAVAAGADLVVPADAVASELARFARTLARVGHPPARVLLAVADAAERGRLAAVLEQSGITVAAAANALEAERHIDLEIPDLVLVAAALPDTDGLTLLRLLRQDPRFHLVPVVVLADAAGAPAQIEALRAGADDWLAAPADAQLLLQLVVTRTERGRRLRELVYRDGLTGLLNHATLMAELELAVEYARRGGGGFALLLLDLDHFRRVNERYGHLVGDQVLAHVAALLRGHVRASDLVGRFGGEEFALVLRGCTPEGAVAVAHKLHALVAETPTETRGGDLIPVRASIGAALFGAHGTTAAELARAADQALQRAKAGGRDRVIFA